MSLITELHVGDYVAYVVIDDSVHSVNWICAVVLRKMKLGKIEVQLASGTIEIVDATVVTKVNVLHVNQQNPAGLVAQRLHMEALNTALGDTLTATDKLETKISFKNCARCGQEHQALAIQKLAQPVFMDEPSKEVLFNYWAPCPTNGDPVLVLKTLELADTP